MFSEESITEITAKDLNTAFKSNDLKTIFNAKEYLACLDSFLININQHSEGKAVNLADTINLIIDGSAKIITKEYTPRWGSGNFRVHLDNGFKLQYIKSNYDTSG